VKAQQSWDRDEGNPCGEDDMAKTTDRKRLEKVARQKKQEWEQALAAKEQEQAMAEQNRRRDEANMDDFFQWCQKTFDKYRLPDTNWEISVSRTPWAEACNLHAYLGDYRLPPGIEFVSLAVAQVGTNTNGRVRRSILLVLVRCVNAHWEIVEETGPSSVATEDDAKGHLINLVAELAAGRLDHVLEMIRKRTGKLTL
jgi:hypothetical protein